MDLMDLGLCMFCKNPARWQICIRSGWIGLCEKHDQLVRIRRPDAWTE